MAQLFRTFAFSHSALPGYFCISWGLHCVPYDTVTSSHGKVLIARHFPLASVNSHSDRGSRVDGRGGGLSGRLCEGEKVSCSYLAVFFRIMSYYLRKSQLIWDVWTGIPYRTFFFSAKDRMDRWLPQNLPSCPKTLKKQNASLLLALFLNGRVPSGIKQMN